MFEIVLEMESDKEKKIISPEDWGNSAAEVAEHLCSALEAAREEEATFLSINNVVVRVENVWGARVRPKSENVEGNVISLSPRR